MAGAGSKMLEMQLTARDMTGAAFNSAGVSMDRYARKSRNGFQSMQKAAMSYTKLVGSIVTAKVLSRGYAMLEQGIYDVTQNIVDMDQALTAASAKFGPGVKKGTAAFAEMQTMVEGIASSTEYTASETAQALDFLGMAGFDYASSLKALPALTDLATASQMDFARASDIASDAMGAFDMSLKPEHIEQNLNRINDVFAETVTTSNTTMETLFDTMKLAGPVVKGGVETFGTLAGTLGSAGIKGTIAATTMKNMFLRLEAPPSEARKALKKLKLEVVDQKTGALKDMLTIIGELNMALAGKGEAKRDKLLKDIFGMRAIAGVNVLLRKGEQALRDYREEIDNSDGAAKEMAETMRTGLGTQIKVLQSALMAKGFEIFKGLFGKEDPVEKIGELIDVIRDFDVGPIVQGLKDIGHFAKEVGGFLWENRNIIVDIAEIWITMSMVSKARSLTRSFVDMAFALTGNGGAVPGMMAMNTNLGEMIRNAGKLKTGFAAAGPVIASAMAGVITGYEIWKEIERYQKKQLKAQNRDVMASMGKDIYGKDLSWKAAKSEMSRLKNEWAASEEDRKKWGEGGLRLEGGRLARTDTAYGKDYNRIQRTARGLERYMEGLAKDSAEKTDIKNRMFAGELFGWASDEQYWTGQGWGMSTTAGREKRGENITENIGEVDGRFVMPAITITPKEPTKVVVEVNNAPAGTTAEAYVYEPKGMAEAALGVPNG